MKKVLIFVQALFLLFCIVWIVFTLFMIPLFIGNGIEVSYAVKMSFVFSIYGASAVTCVGMIVFIIAIICSTKRGANKNETH